MFQSLNRAYKRSDMAPLMRLPPQLRCFNPSIGLTSVPTPFMVMRWQVKQLFQSLNRAYKRSDKLFGRGFMVLRGCFNPSIGLTSVPTAPLMRLPPQLRCFNPSIGLTSVPTLYTILSTICYSLFQSLNRAYKRSDLLFSN